MKNSAEVAHQQVREFLGAVFAAQFVDVKQVAAARDRVEHGHNLPPLRVLAQHAAHERLVARVDLDALARGAAAIRVRAAPKRERLVPDTRRRAEVGLAPALVHRHARRNLVQLAELRHPKVFIEIEVAVVRLRGACVRPQGVQRRAARQDDRVARELDVGGIARELRDVLLEDVRLRLAGR